MGTESMITPEMIEAAAKDIIAAGYNPATAQTIAEIALTAALALHKSGVPGEIEGLIEEAVHHEREYPELVHGPLCGRLAAALRSLAQEVERLTKAAVPLCIGPPLIGILAKEGAWQSSDGQCIVAADDLHGSNPYERIAQLEAALAAAKAAKDQA